MLTIKRFDKNIFKNITAKTLFNIEKKTMKKITLDKYYIEPIYEVFLEKSNFIFLSGKSQIYIALHNEKLIGFILSFYTDPNSADFIPSYVENYKYYISSLYIDPNYQNKGIGTKLLKTLINNLKKTNLDNIYLTVDLNNKNAIAFYLKNNFLIEKKIDKIQLYLLQFKLNN